MTNPHQNNAPLDAARAILGGPLTSVLDGAFRKMEIAEEEIADAKRRSLSGARRAYPPCVSAPLSERSAYVRSGAALPPALPRNP